MTPTSVAERLEAPAGPEPTGDAPAAVRRLGWLPFLLALAVTVPVLKYYGVGYGYTARFAAYTLLANTLPGTLIWRAVRGRAGYLPMDAAFGTTIGFAVELPVYMLVRQLGAPPAVLAWPIVTFALFLAVPRLRPYWRGSGRSLPLGVSWAAALAYLFVLGSIAMSSFRWNSLVEPFSSTMNMDFPFQFALVGEFKHHVPLNTPWLTGTGLQYHWYVYAHGAAASWLTGIEPQTLILRLLPLPMVGAFVLAVIALVHRITRRWWPGALALLLMLAGVAISPYAWSDDPMFTGTITDNLWVSPTQTFAALFFVVVVHVLAGILRSEGPQRRHPAPWILLAFLLGAVAGAKATFIPMVLCGLLLAVALRLIVRRSVGAELVALGITLFWFAFAQFVLYGSGSQGAQIYPLQTVKWTRLGQAVMGRQNPVDQWTPILVLTAAAIVAMAFSWVGMAGLLRREWRMNPVVHVMLGFAASGAGGLWIVAHPGLSQTYFARSASPYLAILSAVGLAALIPAARAVPRRFVVLTAAGSVVTAAALIVVQQTVGRDAPAAQYGGWSLWHAMQPYVLLAGLVAVAVAAATVVAWRMRLGRRYALGTAVIMVLATAVTTGLVGATPLWDGLTSGEPQRKMLVTDARYAMPRGAIKAGRWLRDHSDPLDVVATNSHCRSNVGGCDSRDFWLAAYSERQVVVEGWSYTEQAFETGGLWDGTLARSVFWDQPLLAANDAMFYQPTAANVADFTRAHHVRWLVAVRKTQSPIEIIKNRHVTASPDLGRYATPRFHAGDITIYEVTPAS
ncbi:hypothetical protein [Krasilnikovia sp. MM14-A1259]|uniref:hypothetical protein n=1 Tax=Krasilnikovia sp. MM14-A1259 TaxID=3373539 RepID=UPI0038226AED